MVLESRIAVVIGGAVEDRAVKVFTVAARSLPSEDSAVVDGATEEGAVGGSEVKGRVVLAGAFEDRTVEGFPVAGVGIAGFVADDVTV